MHELNVIVAVDEELYEIQSEEISPLSLEFRNREAARFSGKEVALFPEMELKELNGHAPKDAAGLALATELTTFIGRLKEISSMSVEDGPTVTQEQKDLIALLRVPKRFLFYSLTWKAPHLGIEACVRWEKPVKRQGLCKSR